MEEMTNEEFIARYFKRRERNMKIRRTLEYEGSPEWIEQTLKSSYIRSGAPMSLPKCSIKETSVVEVKQEIDLTKTDEYANGPVPSEDVEICLKMLRTVRGVCLTKSRMSESVILSHAHATLVNLVEEVNEEERKEREHAEGNTNSTAQTEPKPNLVAVENPELGQRFLDCSAEDR